MRSKDLRNLLKQTIPPAVWPLVDVVRETAVSQHMPLYLVGGLVRDLVYGKLHGDLDLILVGDAIKIGRLMERQFGGQLVAHQAFGTAVWSIDDKVWRTIHQATGFSNTAVPQINSIDFVTARKEHYPEPAALPIVTPSDIEADLARRDFTINTMATRLDGENWGQLIDRFNGWDDLHNGVARVLHDLSFVDDPTRMLRGVRYVVRLNLTFEPKSERLLKAALPLLSETTGVRLWHDLALNFQEQKIVEMMALADELGILAHIEPGLGWREETAVAFHAATQAERQAFSADEVSGIYLTIWLLTMEEAVQTAVLQRFTIANATQRHIKQTRQSWEALGALAETAVPSQIVPHLEKVPPWGRLALNCLFANQYQARWIRTYEEKWQFVKPTISGNDLIKLGLKPGPQFKQILDALKMAWLDEKLTNAEAEAALLNQLIAD